MPPPDLVDVRYEVDDRVATITLDRPDALNALNVPMKTSLLAALREAGCDADAGLRAGRADPGFGGHVAAASARGWLDGGRHGPGRADVEIRGPRARRARQPDRR